MPSSKDPNQVVSPGPGRLPAGTVPASAIIPGGGGGGGGGIDLEKAEDVIIPAVYPPTGEALLSPAGPIDGQTVLDFIDQYKDLIPVKPNHTGFNAPAGLNSGIPSWDTLERVGVGAGTALTGGFPNLGTPTDVVFSHYLVPAGTNNFVLSGMIYPADRGVLAIYETPDPNGDYFNAGATNLIAHLWLGAAPAPAGMTSANFNETLRTTQQLNVVGPIGLTFRLPYLSDYSPYPGAPYTPYALNFYRYQLATYTTTPLGTGAVNNSRSFLLVHWKETYATSLAAIQPAGLTIGTLVAANCYSAVPVAGNFDDVAQGIYTLNRHNIFHDGASATAPTINTFTTTNAVVPPSHFVSGITHTNSTVFTFNVNIAGNDLFSNSFQTGSFDAPPVVPTGFHSNFDPIDIGFDDFGGPSFPVPYWRLHKQGAPPGLYTQTNSPAPVDVGEYVNPALALPGAVPFTPNNVLGYSRLKVTLHDPFNAVPVFDTSKRYLFNSYPQTGGVGAISTDTFEPFVDEHYRYITTFNASVSATVRITPSGGDVFPSAVAFVATGPDLQIVTNNLTYPQEDFSLASYFPANAGGNYSTFPAGDGVNHLRRYVRAFNTGIARNTGKLRIRGQKIVLGVPVPLTASDFTANAAYDGTEITGHTAGGLIIQIKVPGPAGSGWLDIGRVVGDPGLGLSDFFGCQTGVTTVGNDIFVSFLTGAFTSDNGLAFGNKFLLFVRVSMINDATGLAVFLDELEWQVP